MLISAEPRRAHPEAPFKTKTESLLTAEAEIKADLLDPAQGGVKQLVERLPKPDFVQPALSRQAGRLEKEPAEMPVADAAESGQPRD